MLAAEIRDAERRLIEASSARERALYRYLTGAALDASPKREGDISELDEACVSIVDSNYSPDESLIARIRRSRPVQGLHYSTDPVALFCFSVHDLGAEREHIEAMLKDGRFRDRLLFLRLWDLDSRAAGVVVNSVDKVAEWVENGVVPDDWYSTVSRALVEADRLLDVYPVVQFHVMNLQASGRADMEAKWIRLQRDMEALTNRVVWFVRCVLFVSILVFGAWLLYTVGIWVSVRWGVYEPWYAVLSTIGGVLILSILAVIRPLRSMSIYKIGDRIVARLATGCLRLLGVRHVQAGE